MQNKEIHQNYEEDNNVFNKIISDAQTELDIDSYAVNMLRTFNNAFNKIISDAQTESDDNAYDDSILKTLNEGLANMGTNYYLLKKENYKKDLIRVKYGLAGFDRVREKENGYFFDGKYYKNISELNKDYYEKYHIGKKSAGWRFLLCSYPELKIKTLNDWKELFKSGIIVDEYGDRVSVNEMCEIIENSKHEAITLKDDYIEQMEIQIDKYGLGIHENRPGCEIFINKDTYDITSNPDFD